MPAAIDLHPSVSIAWVKTVAQVVPGIREETVTCKIWMSIKKGIDKGKYNCVRLYVFHLTWNRVEIFRGDYFNIFKHLLNYNIRKC